MTPAISTFDRPEHLTDTEDPKVLYARSYLLIRAVIGGVGIVLPTLLFVLDWALLRGSAVLRGSLSAYYHSPARDLFVGALCVTGFFLITYMAGQKWTWDYQLSTVAGIAVLGVAFLPTKRPNLRLGDPLCGSTPMPGGCSQLQQALGETSVAAVHHGSATIFILSLAALCFVFARREIKYADQRDVSSRRARLHRICGWTILAGVAWVAIGEFLDLKLIGIHPLYMGEVVSVYAFGLSWTAKASDLYKGLLKKS